MSRAERYALVCAIVAALFLPLAAASARAPRGQRTRHGAVGTAFVAQAPELVVQTGDTLWDLCERNTGKAWIWPQIWALNPQLVNPHWILPGERIAFAALPSGTDALARSAAPPPVADPSRAPAAPAPASGAHALHHVYTGSFLTPEQLVSVGTIVDANADTMMLRPGNTVFVRWDQATGMPAVGESLVAYQGAQRIKHPRTHRNAGYLTEISGTLQVLSVAGRQVEAQVVGAVMEVERGQRVARATRPMYVELTAQPPQHGGDGLVLAVEHHQLMGREQHLVLLDHGRDAGLRPGDRLVVYGRRDGALGPRTQPGTEAMGELVVVVPHQHTSTALVTDARWEVGVGDAFVADPH